MNFVGAGFEASPEFDILRRYVEYLEAAGEVKEKILAKCWHWCLGHYSAMKFGYETYKESHKMEDICRGREARETWNLLLRVEALARKHGYYELPGRCRREYSAHLR